MIGEHSPGTMAERFVAPLCNLLPIGETDPCQATAFGLTHLTAWRMLVTRARVQPGDTVLITGIGGGVALAALRELGFEFYDWGASGSGEARLVVSWNQPEEDVDALCVALARLASGASLR